LPLSFPPPNLTGIVYPLYCSSCSSVEPPPARVGPFPFSCAQGFRSVLVVRSGGGLQSEGRSFLPVLGVGVVAATFWQRNRYFLNVLPPVSSFFVFSLTGRPKALLRPWINRKNLETPNEVFSTNSVKSFFKAIGQGDHPPILKGCFLTRLPYSVWEAFFPFPWTAFRDYQDFLICV